jgi:ABC-type transporter MlaC component
MKSILIAGLIAAYIFTAQDPQIVLSHQYKIYTMTQQLNPGAITKIRDRILNDKKPLPRATKRFIDKNIAWEVFAKSTLNSQWDKLNSNQQEEYIGILKKMMLKRYSKHFDPNKKFSVVFPMQTQYKDLRGQRFAKVKTIISNAAIEFELEVDFIFIFKDEHWMLCDVYVDGVSKSRSYRAAIKDIYKKHGYPGVISKLKKRITKFKSAS